MSPLARRFLHVCLNIRDFGRSGEFYRAGFGLRLAMQTDGAATDGAVLGYQGPILTRASFLYDWRGPRSSSALELVEWFDPPADGRPYGEVSAPGLHAVAFGVASLRQAEERVRAAGGRVLTRHHRSAFAEQDHPTALFLDPDGATVEVTEGAFPAATVLGVRATCSDLDTSVRFYETIGFTVASPPSRGDFVWGKGRAATLALPEDEPGFTLCLVQPDGVDADGTAYQAAHHCGFFRIALRVDDARATHRQLTSGGLAVRGPYPVDLGGTAVSGLNIACLDDPDGILVEFVDRPKSFFRPPRSGENT